MTDPIQQPKDKSENKLPGPGPKYIPPSTGRRERWLREKQDAEGQKDYLKSELLDLVLCANELGVNAAKKQLDVIQKKNVEVSFERKVKKVRNKIAGIITPFPDDEYREIYMYVSNYLQTSLMQNQEGFFDYPFFDDGYLYEKIVNFRERIRELEASQRAQGIEADIDSEQKKGTEPNKTQQDRTKPKVKPSKPDYQHSADYTSVEWFGKQYSFNKTQALCVGHLWAEWEKEEGFGLMEKTIGEKIGSSNENYKLKHTFRIKEDNKCRQHPAWGKMIVPCGKGMFCLKSPKK